MTIWDEIIEQFSRKNNQYIGAEIEMPLINLNKKPVEVEVAKGITKFLENEFQFLPKEKTLDQIVVLAENEKGDTFSFDTTLNTIEFSFRRESGIEELENRFYAYMKPLLSFLKEYNYIICGMGSNPYAQYASSKPLKTPLNMAKSQFLRNFTSHKDGEVFYAFCASTQTHIDVNKESLVEMLNVFNQLNFVNAFLFSNSLPTFSLPMIVEEPTICFRDILWSYSEAPNTGLCDKKFTSLKDLETHLLSLKSFIVPDGNGGVKGIKPIALSDLSKSHVSLEQAMPYFRSLEYVAPNKRGTLEIRSDCTSPLYEIFTPIAFNVGIAQNYKCAEALVKRFLMNHQITLSNSKRREAVVQEKDFVENQIMREFVKEAVKVSIEGLIQRGKGEERYIEHLLKRANSGMSPAQEQKKQLKDSSIETIMHRFSSLKG